MGLRYLRDVVTLALDEAACIGCGRCAEVCPQRVFTMGDHKVRMVHRDRCMECGACATNCPTGAVTVRSGVGCAYAVLRGRVKGTGPDCGCCG